MAKNSNGDRFNGLWGPKESRGNLFTSEKAVKEFEKDQLETENGRKGMGTRFWTSGPSRSSVRSRACVCDTVLVSGRTPARTGVYYLTLKIRRRRRRQRRRRRR